MLETLDHLAARIGQLVAQTRALHAERDALRSRVHDAEQSSQTLRARGEQSESDLQAARAQLAACEQNLADEQHRARQLEADLRAQLAEQASALQTLTARHEASQGAVQRLRTASAQARTRIDAVLERLPGVAPAAAPADIATPGGAQS